MVMVSLEAKMAELDRQLRVWSMPAHIARDIERGEAAAAEHARQKEALLKERADLAEAMAQQVSASEYEKRKAEREAREAAITQAKAALKEVAGEYVEAFTGLVRNLQSAAAGVTRVQALMRTLG